MLKLNLYFLKLALISLISSILISCASVSIQAVKDASFSEPMNKLFILINHGQVDSIDPAYTQYLVANLKEEFTKKNMTINIQVVNQLSLNDNIYWAEVTAGNPDGLMTIVANGGVTGPYGAGLSKIIYDISVFDIAKKKRIWRARLDASGGALVREKRMQMMVKDLINRLTEDKIISSEPRKIGEKL